ncbi:MAG: N-6 DNA methylase [Fimbriimonadales bacterium]|nr:N-6 DNA methylase [Fimbriimonadales bacterium]
MPKSRATQRRLGQYWTPRALAEFMLEAVRPQPDWRVIDPACGEGIFLQCALERGVACAVGIDIDPETLERARENLKPYGDRVRLYLQDGLLPIQDPDPFWQGNYDLVIGNPPYAATGYRVSDPKILDRFELSREPEPEDTEQASLFEDARFRGGRRKPSVAIEVLFLERFFQLCKPGGMVAIVAPRGIAANRNLMYVRKWLILKHSVRCILEPDATAFKGVGTNALTSVFIVDNYPSCRGDRVMLAALPPAQWNLSLYAPENERLYRTALLVQEVIDHARALRYQPPEEIPEDDCEEDEE